MSKMGREFIRRQEQGLSMTLPAGDTPVYCHRCHWSGVLSQLVHSEDETVCPACLTSEELEFKED